MGKVLVLYTYVDGVNDTPFPSAEDPIEIGAFRYDAKRMGGAPIITARERWKTPSLTLHLWKSTRVNTTPSSMSSTSVQGIAVRHSHTTSSTSEDFMLNL